ncbi:PspA/IM30 family protein [Devosia sp. Root105]|uniref:PspA/IM30 family protein n=1 Tax=Devosia sp. Root105 TaxID=1736423 RepID=UPI0006FA0B9F|nr:PspA/IM30 family protein [Devosia sp. Root105]KQU99610.1 phage shock protein A [Devosia sp. Root105]
MLNVLKTLFRGASARAEEQLTDHFAIDLIEQKIRESEGALSLAKSTLAALIIRQRNETQTLSRLETQIDDLETRARQALAAGREDLAADAATAIANLENERAVRRDTLDQLANRVARTQASVEKANRRIIDLRQGMISARAADAERKAQKSLNRSIGATSSIREAEELIARVVNGPDPFAESEVLDEIDAGLSEKGIRDRLGEAGFGDKTKVHADDVLARLKSTSL